MMGRVSATDKIRIQTLRELGLGYRAVTKRDPDKQPSELGSD